MTDREKVDWRTADMNKEIDIVIPWVDGSDAKWIQEKRYWYQRLNPDRESNSDTRYQNWDNLAYWFRAVETCLPWFHRICFITWGHVPDFLNLNHPKLKVVRHEDFIPREFLPTFQVNAIEMNLHRIPELSEKDTSEIPESGEVPGNAPEADETGEGVDAMGQQGS